LKRKLEATHVSSRGNKMCICIYIYMYIYLFFYLLELILHSLVFCLSALHSVCLFLRLQGVIGWAEHITPYRNYVHHNRKIHNMDHINSSSQKLR
jgi:hypothetical protein